MTTGMATAMALFIISGGLLVQAHRTYCRTTRLMHLALSMKRRADAANQAAHQAEKRTDALLAQVADAHFAVEGGLDQAEEAAGRCSRCRIPKCTDV
jgi:hypothetical protein